MDVRRILGRVWGKLWVFGGMLAVGRMGTGALSEIVRLRKAE
jgi:hypothetical protein